MRGARVHAGADLRLLDAADGEPVPGDVVLEQLHGPLVVVAGHDRLVTPVAPGGVAAGVGAPEGQARLGDRDGLVVLAGADPDGGALAGVPDRGLDRAVLGPPAMAAA